MPDFKDTYNKRNWLANPETPYRQTTDAMAAAVTKNDVATVQTMLDNVNDPAILANALQFPQTSYYHPTREDERQIGDKAGPLFTSHGRMVEEYAFDTHGTRFLGIALQSHADDAVKLLIKQGARIPGGNEFPEEAMKPGKKAGYSREVTEGFTTVVTSGIGSGPTAVIQQEYEIAVREWIGRAKDDSDRAERVELAAQLGVGHLQENAPADPARRIGPTNPEHSAVNLKPGRLGAAD